MIYCVIPRELEEELYDKMVTYYEENPDVTVIISDDQDEWFYEHNMPRFAVYWGESAPLIPRSLVEGASQMATMIARGYGDVAMAVPVASRFGRYLVEYLCDHGFDPAHITHAQQPYGGKVARRYPTPDGEITVRIFAEVANG